MQSHSTKIGDVKMKWREFEIDEERLDKEDQEWIKEKEKEINEFKKRTTPSTRIWCKTICRK